MGLKVLSWGLGFRVEGFELWVKRGRSQFVDSHAPHQIPQEVSLLYFQGPSAMKYQSLVIPHRGMRRSPIIFVETEVVLRSRLEVSVVFLSERFRDPASSSIRAAPKRLQPNPIYLTSRNTELFKSPTCGLHMFTMGA